MKVPTVVTDALENIRFGLKAMWVSMSPAAKSFCWGLGIGTFTGAFIVYGLLA